VVNGFMVTPWVVVLSVASDRHPSPYRVVILVGPYLFVLQALIEVLRHQQGLRVVAPSSEMLRGSVWQVLSELGSSTRF